jgi:phosphate transport system permease protein
MRGTRRRSDLLGQSFTWLCGGALAVNLLLAIGLVALIASHGLAYFWQKPLLELELDDGSRVLGEVHEREDFAPAGATEGSTESRMRVKIGNRDLYGLDFRWVEESKIRSQALPPDAVLLERLEWGNFYGDLVELRRGEDVLASGSDAVWKALGPLLRVKAEERERIRDFERQKIGDVNYEIDRLRLAAKRLALENISEAAKEEQRREIESEQASMQKEYDTLAEQLFEMRGGLTRESVIVESADGRRKEIAAGNVVRALRPNSMGLAANVTLYFSRIWEFLSGEPRESNTEGGIFPAIFGTVMMVFLMSFAVAPFGVLAALYLREYARDGLLVRIVRIAVNNLAGVPSIVFGVFGLGFFVYLIGGTIDRVFYPEALPTPTFGTGGILWASLTLALLTVPVVIVAAEEGLAAVPRVVREGSLALGATKFETTWRVVLPAAMPGILTGMILAMARAAGEVAPLMIVGMVKLAPTLPIDGRFPFVHLERKFMHLGFHIYDVGFQSPNVEATEPLVFATALLLIVVVTAMNLIAVTVRNRLRRKYATSAV